MWPYTETESYWISEKRLSERAENPDNSIISSDRIAYHIANGRRLQRQEIHRMTRAAITASRNHVRTALHRIRRGVKYVLHGMQTGALKH